MHSEFDIRKLKSQLQECSTCLSGNLPAVPNFLAPVRFWSQQQIRMRHVHSVYPSDKRKQTKPGDLADLNSIWTKSPQQLLYKQGILQMEENLNSMTPVSPFYRWKNWGPWRGTVLPKVTHMCMLDPLSEECCLFASFSTIQWDVSLHPSSCLLPQLYSLFIIKICSPNAKPVTPKSGALNIFSRPPSPHNSNRA